MNYNTYNKKLNRGQLLWPAECMLINKVSDDVLCQWICHDVVISIGGIHFKERFVCWMIDYEQSLFFL